MNRRQFLGSAAATWFLHGQTVVASKELRCDIAIVGGGTGGVAAALAALDRGMTVIMTEPTLWVGGQLTAQAVPPDEHPYIERFGCTGRYRRFRNEVRAYYRERYPLTAEAAARASFNPGNAGVSQLCGEFKVYLAVLEAMLQPYLASGKLTLLPRHEPVDASMRGDRVESVTVRSLETGNSVAVTAAYFLDATELGELLPLTGAAFVTGTQARGETGELHAPDKANPAGSQGFTFPFAMDHMNGEDHTISKPARYDVWRNYVPKLKPGYPGRQLSWSVPMTTDATRTWTQYLMPNPDAAHDTWGNLWFYRRVADRRNFRSGAYPSDIVSVNWLQNDYSGGDLLTAMAADRPALLENARQLSLSLLYWMQTEAPRLDGGTGFRGLRLRSDITGTKDGLSMHPYIRESRRLRAKFTVTEAHVGTQMRMVATGKSKTAVRAAQFADSVGVGAYKLDLHPTAGGDNVVDLSALPFQIPLGALLPVRIENLLAAAKNIGTTHLSNSCYREHVTEWNVGEAAGAVAAHAVLTRTTPAQILEQPKLLSACQADLRRDGFELEWPAEASALDW